MEIVIIGALGFLGTKLMKILPQYHEVIGADIKGTGKNKIFQLDATNKFQVKKFILNHKPNVVIDLVALTSSASCEENPLLCKKLNYETAKNIVEACKSTNCKMIFISSSYIFDGKKGNYSEFDNPSPLNEYGKYKIMAEKEISNLKEFIILRTDVMYGFNGLNENNGVFNKILSNDKITIKDPFQLRSPLFVDDVAEIIHSLLLKNANGIFHMSGPDKISMFNFLKGLEKILRKDSKIIINKELPSVVQHPENATLNISKLLKLGIKPHSFEDSLKIIKEQLSKS